jgi:RNA polymerase sigma factor (sigma-70 family)
MGLQGRAPLLRLQSDEKLIAYTRRGNQAAFEVLVSRYQVRLLAFCRHLLGSREDAEDVLQEVFAAAFNALLADDRPINVRPWLYRIARNRSLNHLRRATAIGVDSMDIHFSEHGTSTADKVQQREQFRLLVDDIQSLPETQRSALILREMDALSYDQIAEAMDTTVPGVKSLLVRARISLAEAAEARQLSCSEVRVHLGEIAEGLRRKPEPPFRRHLKSCQRCSSFNGQLKTTSKALGVLLPLGPLALLKRVLIAHLGHASGSSTGAGAGAGMSAGGGATAGTGATTAGLGGGALAAGTAGGVGSVGMFSAGAGALATKAAAGLAAAVVVTAGAVEVDHVVVHHPAATSHRHPALIAEIPVVAPAAKANSQAAVLHHKAGKAKLAADKKLATKAAGVLATTQPGKTKTAGATTTATTPKHQLGTAATLTKPAKPKPLPGRTETQTAGTTVLPSQSTGTGGHKGTSGGKHTGTHTSSSGTHTGTGSSTSSTPSSTSTTPTSTSTTAS